MEYAACSANILFSTGAWRDNDISVYTDEFMLDCVDAVIFSEKN